MIGPRIVLRTKLGPFQRVGLARVHATVTRADKLLVNNRPASTHITEDQRENYLLNRLPAGEKNQLREHCARCGECLAALDEDDVFISALRIATNGGARPQS